MLRPKALKIGDTIGIVATSSPTTQEKVKSAKKELEALGFKVKLAPSCHATRGYLAGDDQMRADDLNGMFADQEVKGIICLRGGYGAPKILKRVDFELIKNNPKVFVGYSDITALHMAMNQICGLVTFHGPMAASDIAGGLDEFSEKELIRAITESIPMGKISNPEEVKIETLVGGKTQGIIIGGNLSLIAATMGTPYEIDTKGKILFLEEIGEEPYSVDRMLTQLALAGKFDDAVGIILGDWNNCEAEKPEESLSLMEVLEEMIVPYGKPTIYNLKAGHCTPKVTLPFGVMASLDADTGSLTIEEGATE
ncbi:S66 peptidase family protein [Alkaliphilus hydrothermalis]|uniref:Muramoyltetrapeptide carboxypeptidase n=1 Tax=Alkaliphilus hydrothermalis TaxID=1482730 RepID=A0ABS2NT53_9FIRM|nr:LD-carboxypeptidase [Alkaliphilus hydrothermalis]MBM7616123.1 muramoyltetrapeptide carboxypeptidase [Alkaliphilus hydrothermalis]